MSSRAWVCLSACTLVGLYTGCDMSSSSDQAEPSDVEVLRAVTVTPEVHHDTSMPFKMMPPAARPLHQVVHEVMPLPRPGRPAVERDQEQALAAPLVLRDSLSMALAPTSVANFDGIGNGVAGFTVNSAPPDTDGDVGPNHYMEIVNTDIAVFNKTTGALIMGPVATNTLWSGFGGLCQTDNDGDGVVVYDPIADRWVVSQFAVSGTSTHFLHCVAVSTTPDPTGSYARYSFDYGNAFPDYPKMGVWPDAYYQTFNFFNAAGTSFLGARVCAYDRTKMLAGQAATQVCFTPNDAGSVIGGLLPADLDGAQLPPSGTPNFVVALGNNANQLAVYKFHVDFATPSNSTLTGPFDIAVTAFTEGCGGGTCVPQAGTSQKLDSLGDRLMFRLAYRNFGDHDALLATHTVSTSTSTTAATAIRWYELRGLSGTPSVFQSGTFTAPGTSVFAWMSSAAMDQSGNIAVGYSTSSTAQNPAIHFTGRLVGDAAGTMSQGDNVLITGAGSQTGNQLSRWGDYSAMSVDPSDDCTFFYTNEYIPANGSFNWKTRVGSFKLPGCGAAAANDFSISASPASVSIAQGASGSVTINTAVTSGSAETVSLSASGVPAGASASFSPSSVTAGGSSTLSISVGATTTPGTYSITVTGTSPSASHSTSVSLTVPAPAGNQLIVNGGFEGGASPWTLSGNATASSGTGAHSGSGFLTLGATNNSSGAAFQAINVPAASAPQLTFFLNVTTNERTTTNKNDQFFVEIIDASGTVSTLATFSNLDGRGVAVGAYTPRGPFSLSTFAGQTIRVQFRDTTNRTRTTTFRVDDVSAQ
jgi:hypothetical protein